MRPPILFPLQAAGNLEQFLSWCESIRRLARGPVTLVAVRVPPGGSVHRVADTDSHQKFYTYTDDEGTLRMLAVTNHDDSDIYNSWLEMLIAVPEPLKPNYRYYIGAYTLTQWIEPLKEGMWYITVSEFDFARLLEKAGLPTHHFWGLTAPATQTDKANQPDHVQRDLPNRSQHPDRQRPAGKTRRAQSDAGQQQEG